MVEPELEARTHHHRRANHRQRQPAEEDRRDALAQERPGGEGDEYRSDVGEQGRVGDRGVGDRPGARTRGRRRTAPPARTSSQPSLRRVRCASVRPRRSSTSHGHSKGSARKTRWKAVALGPSSLRRTKMGEKAIAVAPASSAGRARRAWPGGVMRWPPASRGYRRFPRSAPTEAGRAPALERTVYSGAAMRL